MADGAIRDAGGISIPVTVDPSTMKPGFEEVKRIIARSPNVIKIKPEMDFQEGQITRAMNKAIREAERASAKLAADVRLINEKSFVFEPRVKFSKEAVEVRVAEMIRTAKERAAREQIEIAAKVKYAEDTRVLGPQTRTLTARAELVSGRTEQERAFRSQLAATLSEARAEVQRHKLTLDVQTRLIGTGDLEAEATQRFLGTRGMVLRPSVSAGRIGGGEHRSLASFNPFSQKGLERAFGFAAAGFVVTEGARLAGDYFGEENRRLRASSNVANQAQARLNSIQTAGSIPVIGIGVRVADQITGASAAQQRVIEDERQRVAAGESSIKSKRAQSAVIAGLRGDSVGAIRLGAEQRIVDAKKIALLTGDNSIVKREETIRDLQIRDEEERRAASRQALYRSTSGAEIRIQASQRRRIIGDEEGAAQMERVAERQSLVSAHEQRLVGVKNADDRKAIEAANAKEIAAFDEETDAQAAERKKRRAVDTASAVSAAMEAGLRVQKRNYEADLQAFDDATQQKLSLINDVEARQNEMTRRMAERSVIVANHERQINESVAIARANTSANELRIQRRDYEAEKQLFEANAKAKLDAIEDPRLKKAAQDEIDSQRRLMEEGHGRQQADIVLGYQARVAEAQVRGQFHDRTAGMIGALAGMGSELRAVAPENRQQLIATQEAELQSMQDRILKPRSGGRATEVDVRAMAFSDPFSDKKQEDTEILKLIASYLKDIKDNGGNGARLN